jgi:glycerol-3-phosphate dehydrogenase
MRRGENRMLDVVIIGAGITGTMIAKDLSRYRLKTALVEKQNDIACGATMANSAIVHTGYDPEDNTLKAKLNVRGAQLYEGLCRDLGCNRKVIGAYIAACGDKEEEHLHVLSDRAERRGIPYEWLDRKEAHKEEPNLSDEVTKVLSFPTTAVIYPWEVAIACTQVAMGNGTSLYLNSPVTKIEKTENGFTVKAGSHVLETRYVINAAGVYADKIHEMIGTPRYHMTPKRGEYYVLDHNQCLVNHIVFPVPGIKGKGVLAIPTVYGNTLIGPSSDLCEDPDDNENTYTGLDYVRSNISRIIKNVPLNQSIRTFAGLRPSSSSKDFIIEEAPEARGFIDVASIESPGLASAPGVSEYVIHTVMKDLKLEENPDAVMTRKRPPVIAEMTEDEKQNMIRKNPLYGKIICRCEQISEGEIIDCIHQVCGATTVKGVKKRVRPGMGRCQGGFCEPRVVSILARELHCGPMDVLYDGKGSQILEKENR